MVSKTHLKRYLADLAWNRFNTHRYESARKLPEPQQRRGPCRKLESVSPELRYEFCHESAGPRHGTIRFRVYLSAVIEVREPKATKQVSHHLDVIVKSWH